MYSEPRGFANRSVILDAFYREANHVRSLKEVLHRSARRFLVAPNERWPDNQVLLGRDTELEYEVIRKWLFAYSYGRLSEKSLL